MPQCKQTTETKQTVGRCSLCGGDHSERWCHQFDTDTVDDFWCPRCGEEITFYAPDAIGKCSNCHYNTEEGR